MATPAASSCDQVHVAHVTGGVYLGTFQSGAFSQDHISAETLTELVAAEPSCVYETSVQWQLVPKKLFRKEDKSSYLSGSFPSLTTELLSTLPIPALGAVAIFERNAGLPNHVASGNHVVELFLAASAQLSMVQPNHALAFFIGDKLWLLLCRAGQIVFAHAHRIVSDTDAVFYIAANFQHFGLMREETRLFVGGHILSLGSLHRQLSIYFELTDLAEGLNDLEQERHKAVVAEQSFPAQEQLVQLLLAYQWGLRSLTVPE